METEITAEQFYERLAKLQEEKSNPKVSPEHPLMICIKCDSRYTLPLLYEKCNTKTRDLCPNCIIDLFDAGKL